MCHTCPSVADFELCEPVKKNYPLLKTLVSRLTSIRSQAGNLSRFYQALTGAVYITKLVHASQQSPWIASRVSMYVKAAQTTHGTGDNSKQLISQVSFFLHKSEWTHVSRSPLLCNTWMIVSLKKKYRSCVTLKTNEATICSSRFIQQPSLLRCKVAAAFIWIHCI